MDEWRREWHAGTGQGTDPNFPIGFVQIGPLGGTTATDTCLFWGFSICKTLEIIPRQAPDKQKETWLRWLAGTPGPVNSSLKTFQIRMGQTADYGFAPNAAWPHSFMATAFDLANPPGTKCFWGCVHIFNKQAVAHRLALAARHNVYGETSLVGSGPTVTSVAAHGTSGAVVSYGEGTEGGGIALRSKYGFEVCAKDCGGEKKRLSFPSRFTYLSQACLGKSSLTKNRISRRLCSEQRAGALLQCYDHRLHQDHCYDRRGGRLRREGGDGALRLGRHALALLRHSDRRL